VEVPENPKEDADTKKKRHPKIPISNGCHNPIYLWTCPVVVNEKKKGLLHLAVE